MIGTGAGIIFRGSGFYQTDYRSDSYKKSVESEKSASAPAKSEPSSSAAPSAPAPAAASTDKKKAG
jgi:predicted nucleic acid-binding Zn ribbon protein